MVLLTTTPRIISAIASLSPSDKTAFTSNAGILPTSSEDPIDHKTLLTLSRLVPRSRDHNGSILNTLLRGTRVYVPHPPPKSQPSPEYLALMDRLRREQEQRDYARLISTRIEDTSLADDEQQDDVSPSLVLNIFLSIILCAAAVFQLTKYWANDGVRVLFSLGTAIVVGVAEVGVYMAYLRKVETSKNKERNKKERKVVIGEYTGEEESIDAHGRLVSIDAKMIMEKEEIWGRGINGGMRRRVREKWEKEHSQAS